MPKFKINVDLDSAREEAEDLESRTIEAKDEDEAMRKAAKIVKEEMYHGPYYNVTEEEIDETDYETKWSEAVAEGHIVGSLEDYIWDCKNGIYDKKEN